MQRMKMILIAGLVGLLGLGFCGIFSETRAQSGPTLDLSKKTVQDRIWSSGFIATKPLPSIGRIVGSRDEILFLTEGDLIYIKLEPEKQAKAGDRFSIARVEKEIKHPITKEPMGNQVRLPGMVVILENRGNMAVAKLEKTFFPANHGDLIIPCVPAPPVSINPRYREKIKGAIVASPDESENLTEGEVVYIDRGTQDGVIVGDPFTIYQMPYHTDKAKEETSELPMLKVGRGVIVSVNVGSASMFITHSTQAIYIGDTILSGQGE